MMHTNNTIITESEQEILMEILLDEGVKDALKKAKDLLRSGGDKILKTLVSIQSKVGATTQSLEKFIEEHAPQLNKPIVKKVLLAIIAGLGGLVLGAEFTRAIDSKGTSITMADVMLAISQGNVSEEKNTFHKNWKKFINEQDIAGHLEEEILKFLNEDALEEGFMDRILPYVLAGGAALGGMSAAQAKPISPKQATSQLVKVLNKEVGKRKNRFGLPLKFNEIDPSVEKVGRSISRLTKAIPPEKNEKEIINIIAKGILSGVDKEVDASDMLDAAVRKLDSSTAKVLKKKRRRPKRDIVNAKFRNPRFALLNSLNGIAAQMIQNKSFKKEEQMFLKNLEFANSAGGISKQEYRKIKTIYNGKGSFSSKYKKISNILNPKGQKK